MLSKKLAPLSVSPLHPSAPFTPSVALLCSLPCMEHARGSEKAKFWEWREGRASQKLGNSLVILLVMGRTCQKWTENMA